MGPKTPARPVAKQPSADKPAPPSRAKLPLSLAQGQGAGIDELARHLAQRLRTLVRGRGGRGVRPWLILAIAAMALTGWLATGLYDVRPDERAVITRFGAYVGQSGPGLGFHLPAPIERARRVSVTGLHRLDIDASGGEGAASDSAMLTSDGDLVELGFGVDWRIADASAYLFHLAAGQDVLKRLAEAVVRQEVGASSSQALRGAGRAQIQARAAQRLQALLNSYGAGVRVVGVQIRDAAPPAQLSAASQDMVNAGQDAAAAVNQGDTYRDQAVDAAKVEATRTVREAEGQRDQEVRVAGGEASHFTQVEAGYRAAPALTRQRIYLDTMRWVLSRSNKVVVDVGKGSGTPVMLPSELFKPRRPADTTAASPPPAQAQARTGQDNRPVVR